MYSPFHILHYSIYSQIAAITAQNSAVNLETEQSSNDFQTPCYHGQQ